MGDATYRNLNFIFRSRGISARSVDDTLEEGWYLNESNCEELAENAVSNRLGSSLINRTGNSCQPLGGGVVHSLNKLSSLNNFAYRYAGCGPNLYRRDANGQGAYDQIFGGMSGAPWQAQTYGATEFTSMPYIFFADRAVMLKDNGTLAAPQRSGIIQPQVPVLAHIGQPLVVPLDPAAGNTYSTNGVSGFTPNTITSPTTALSADVGTGIQEALVIATPNPMGLFQYVTVGTETVLVLKVTALGFIANFTAPHSAGENVTGRGYIGLVSSTGTFTTNFNGTPIEAFPGVLQQADYISMQLFVSDPTDIQQIIIKFDCGDGSFNSDYFYKVVAQGPLQSLLNQASQPATAATDIIISESLGVYGNQAGNVAQLSVGQNTTTPLLIQLSDFAGSGRANFSDPTFNWQNVNGMQVIVVTNNNNGETVQVQVSSVVLFGGYGPDVFAGVAYDYLYTFFNAVDGTESNPCMVMSNVNPPLNTNWLYPRRQPVELQLNLNVVNPFGGAEQDSQITHVRIYRRGGTLGDNYRRIDQVPVNIAAGGFFDYEDSAADIDIQGNDFVSFENDVPVTSSLPTPVNTTLDAALQPASPGQVIVITPDDISNISPCQQVTIGTPGALANNLETVIALSVTGASFTAFVQNQHAVGEQVTATAKYCQPVTIIASAYGSFWYAGDPNNPNYLYWSSKANPQYVSSAAWVPVGSPDDPITAVVEFKGNLFVSTIKFWWAVAPGSNANGQPTVYPTAAKHGCVAPLGWTATEDAIYYQAIDGIRRFAGGGSEYLTQDQEFIFQGIGSSPIVQANQSALSQTRMAYWNMMLNVCFIGVDGQPYRLIYHQVYKRWRNASMYGSSIFLEADTNILVFGDPIGGVHVDRQNQAYDEVIGANNILNLAPIPINLQSPYSDQGEPSITKSYQELTLDIDTSNQPLTVTMLFEDGQQTGVVGTVKTAQRQKVNFSLNAGLGYEFYKVSLQITGSVKDFVNVYQASLRSLPLAKTRKSFDTFWLKLGTDESKVVKQLYLEYTIAPSANTALSIPFNVYYDGSATPGFTFTLPGPTGLRRVQRVRLPAIACRMIRFVGTCPQDFQIWESSKVDVKPIASGKGWEQMELVPNG